MILRFNLSRCVYCPNKFGALKKINGKGWVHVACVDLMQELNFAEGEKKETIIELKKIPEERVNKLCQFCKKEQGILVKVN